MFFNYPNLVDYELFETLYEDIQEVIEKEDN
jgi:hypothetical protein